MRILFICRSNAERSQVAEALFNAASRRHRAFSAGIMVEKDKAQGQPPGRIMSELMLSMGRHEILRMRRKQLTRVMIRQADKVVVILGKKEIEEFLPAYVRQSPKTIVWDVGFMSLQVYKSFPPSTYHYHLRWVDRIQQNVADLVEEIG